MQGLGSGVSFAGLALSQGTDPWRDDPSEDPGSAPRLETVIPGFDSISNGGIPKGRSTLVVEDIVKNA